MFSVTVFADEQLIYTPKAKGADVVEAVISKIDASCIFPDFKLFLRRLAYVESKDGNSLGFLVPRGGIWKVCHTSFKKKYH